MTEGNKMAGENRHTGGRTFGYARVSSREQNLDRQLLALGEVVPEGNILVDKASGKNLE